MTAWIKPSHEVPSCAVTNPIFSHRFARWLARSQDIVTSYATKSEVEAAVAIAGRVLPIADLAVVMQIFELRPDGFRCVRSEHDFGHWPMMAHLPLNARGVAALVEGTFDGLDPRLDHIAGADEKLEGVYLWLLFSPGRLSAGVRLVADAASMALSRGKPVFARPSSPTSARIMSGMGAVGAATLFPNAPEWLVVVVPNAAPANQSQRTHEVRVARSMDDLMRVFSIRTAAFVVGQHADHDEEFDGNDLSGTHLLASIDGEPAGCARIRYFGDFAKFERFAVLPRFRRSALMSRLARACIEHVRMKGFTRIYAHARSDLVPVWERFGARTLGRAPFSFSDVEFHELVLDLVPSDCCLRLGSDPMVLNRPEGSWHELGPIDRAQLRCDRERQVRISREVKRFNG